MSILAQVSSSQSPAAGADQRRFGKGTLSYTRSGLVLLLLSLFWGDLCLSLMEACQAILPITMRTYGASNTTIALSTITLDKLCILILAPTISFISDRTRTRFGRRRPFLFVLTPILFATLVLLALAPDLGGWLHSSLAGWAPERNSLIVGVVVTAIVMFFVVNQLTLPLIYYLVADVVPDRFFGRFIAIFQIIGMGAAALFNYLILPLGETHHREIFLGAAVIFLIGYTIMCLAVKEGEYPPPPSQERRGILASAGVYLRECYWQPHYFLFFLRNALFMTGQVVVPFAVFFPRNGLGLSLKEVGTVFAVNTVASACLIYPFGAIVDRFSAVVVLIIPLVVLPLLDLTAYFWVDSFASYQVFGLLSAVAGSLVMAGTLPFYYAIMPRDRFGQFASANQVFIALFMMPAGFAAGALLDVATAKGGDPDAYRICYLWSGAFRTLALLAHLAVHRNWLRLGGKAGYVPP